MKTIIANNSNLKKIILSEIDKYGDNCYLNHIDVSNVTRMDYLFQGFDFNGDISKWNTAKVETMSGMFMESNFNGDITAWNIHSVRDMSAMFYLAEFNQDISCWRVNSVTNMRAMFQKSKFSYDLDDWTPFKLLVCQDMFEECSAPTPFWFNNIGGLKEALRIRKRHDRLNHIVPIKEEKDNKKLKI